MSQPLVSIIMPAYNAGNFIQQAIESVIKQTYTNWELLIINDGSTDKTQQVIDSFSDKRIKSFQQVNKGVSAARNVGLAHMVGAYFTFLDADDLLPENSIEKRLIFLQQHEEVTIVAGAVEFFDTNKDKIVKIWRPSFKGNPLVPFIRLNENVFCNPSYMIRASKNVDYKFLEGMTHVEDLLFFTQIAAAERAEYSYIDEIIYEYRTAGTSAMSNLDGLGKGYYTFYEKVKQLGVASKHDLNYLYARITRIMFLSFLRTGKIKSASYILFRFLLKK